MDEADALEALANTLTLLTENPHDISLHAQHVRLARETDMKDQLEAALYMVTTFWAAGDYVWIPLIDIRIEDADLEDSEGINEVLALFQRAEEDYLCTYLALRRVLPLTGIMINSNTSTQETYRIYPSPPHTLPGAGLAAGCFW